MAGASNTPKTSPCWRSPTQKETSKTLSYTPGPSNSPRVTAVHPVSGARDASQGTAPAIYTNGPWVRAALSPTKPTTNRPLLYRRTQTQRGTSSKGTLGRPSWAQPSRHRKPAVKIIKLENQQPPRLRLSRPSLPRECTRQQLTTKKLPNKYF